MSKRSLSLIFATALLVTPFMAMAQQRTLRNVIYDIIGYLNDFLWLLIAFAVVVFVYYVIQYFIKPNEDRKNAGQYVMYSLIGFFVVLSFWGLVAILQNTFGLKNELNQPAGWTSFKSLFPSPGGSSGASSNPGNVGGRTGNPGNVGGQSGAPGSVAGQTSGDPCPLGAASGPNCQ